MLFRGGGGSFYSVVPSQGIQFYFALRQATLLPSLNSGKLTKGLWGLASPAASYWSVFHLITATWKVCPWIWFQPWMPGQHRSYKRKGAQGVRLRSNRGTASLKKLHKTWAQEHALVTGLHHSTPNSYQLAENVSVTKSHLTLGDPMDYSPPGSSVHGLSQARILEWAAISFCRGSSQPKDQIHVSYIASRLTK